MRAKNYLAAQSCGAEWMISMPFFTQPLINGEFKKKLLSKPEAHYYLAADLEEGTLFLWFETKIFGRAACYPCIIRGEDALVLKNDNEEGAEEDNEIFIEEWSRRVDPEKVRGFKFVRLAEDEIKTVYAALKDVNEDVFPLYERLGIDFTEDE